MRRREAEAFLEEAQKRLQAAPGEAVPAGYLNLLEAHFHRMDRGRTDLPLWPCNLGLVPAPAIRAAAGPVSYRMLFYGLAEHLWLTRHVCGYRGDQHLLDVGCGYGKTALALLRTIRPPGSYTGFDIQPNLIEFLRTLFAQLGVGDYFRAHWFPVGNRFYGGAGRPLRAEEFVFPYEANQFDCAVLFSVFTHLRSEAATNYVRNLARVVKPGGRVLVSAFLLDNAPEGGTGGGPWSDSPRRRALQEPTDPGDRGRLRLLDPANPEYLVAYQLEYLRSTFGQFGCHPVGDPLWGSWSGRSDFLTYQDSLVFQKRAG